MNKKVLHTVFEKVARAMPSNIAIESDSAIMSYSDLNTQSNRLAHLLGIEKIGKDDIVVAYFDNKVLQLISLLGIFKSGATYLPLDKKYNLNHWQELYEHIRPEMLLISEDNLEPFRKYAKLFEYSIPRVIVISKNNQFELFFWIYKLDAQNDVKNKIEHFLPAMNPALNVCDDDSSYIFFTSGSSGTPKAVLGNHKSLSHFVHWESTTLNITDKVRVGVLTSFSFDASLRDIFVPLINGGTICIPGDEISTDATGLCNWLNVKKISLLHTVPTMLRFLTRKNEIDNVELSNLKYLLIAGEKLYERDIIAWRKSHGFDVTIINLYGATESTLVKTFYKIPKNMIGDPSDTISVGKPISNTIILIISSSNKLCKVNEVGEIYIKTPFLSKGYLNNPEQTGEKFVQNPFNKAPDIIYKTGDYGRYDTFRNIFVLGRRDGIIKINGVRCDVNSIEQSILHLSQVKMVKCLPHRNENGEVSIICFYSSNSPIETKIKQHCWKFLSQYEIPAFFIALDNFPTNANGKIDTVMLNEKAATLFRNKTEYKAPKSLMEENLISIWEKILNVEKIGIDDDFFALGGQSLKMIQVINQINQILQVRISIVEFYEKHTVEQLAKFLEQKIKRPLEQIRPIPKSKNGYAISNEQLRLWLACQSPQGSIAHNMESAYTIKGKLDLKIFKKVLGLIVERHEAFRTSFSMNREGEVVQFISDCVNIDSILTYHSRGNGIEEKEVKSILKAFSEKRFDLENGPLFNVLLIKTGDFDYVLSFLIHHLVGDFLSNEILYQEIIKLYSMSKNGGHPQLEKLEIQYKDYVAWIRNKLSKGEFDMYREYWNEKLEGIRPEPKWHKEPIGEDFMGLNFTESFSPELTDSIQKFCKLRNCGLMGLVAVALGIVLSKMIGYQDILIGLPLSLRSHSDLENQVGLYLNLSLLRIRFNSTDTIGQLLGEVENQRKFVLDSAFYPFDTIVEEFENKNNINLINRIDFYLNVIQHSDKKDLKIENFQFNPRKRGYQMSKFPICFYINQSENAISYRIEYQRKVFSQTEISKLADRFCKSMKQLLECPDMKIGSINLIDKKLIPSFEITPSEKHI